jgi:hypothetical protein
LLATVTLMAWRRRNPAREEDEGLFYRGNERQRSLKSSSRRHGRAERVHDGMACGGEEARQ